MNKIIFIHLLNDFSGSPKVLSQIVKSYKNKNHDVELFTSKDEGFLSNIITSSPSLTPNQINMISNPVVAEFRQIVLLFPQYSARSFSNFFVLGPVVIHPDFRVSTTSSIIF